MLAFTSELIPRLVYRYKYKDDNAYSGFIDFSLSEFPVAEFDEDSKPENATLNGWPQQDICRYLYSYSLLNLTLEIPIFFFNNPWPN